MAQIENPITNINEEWGGQNPHTGAEVEQYIKNYLRNLTTSTNSRIKDISFDTLEGSTVNCTITRTDNDTGLDITTVKTFTLRAVSQDKIYLSISDYPKYVSPGSDFQITYGYYVKDVNGELIQRQPTITAKINDKDVEIGLANTSLPGGGTKSGSFRIDSKYLKEGVNEVIVNFSYSDSNGEASANSSPLNILSFTPKLSIEGIDISRIYDYENDAINIVPTITDNFGQNLTSGKYSLYYNNEYSIRIKSISDKRTSIINNNTFSLNLITNSNVLAVNEFYLQAEILDNNSNVIAYSNGVKYQLLSTTNLTQTRFAFKLDNCSNLSLVSNESQIEQYDNFSIQLYSQAVDNTKFSFKVNDVTIRDNETLEKINGLYNASWTYLMNNVGQLSLSISASTGTSITFNVNVMSIGNDLVIPSDYTLKLSANGKSKDSRTWEYRSYSTVFTNFDWSANGWDNALVTNNNAVATIQYSPCQNEIGTYGRTVSFRIKTSNENTNEELIKCYTSGRDGFIIYPQKAVVFKGSKQTETKFSTETDEYKEITFVWYPESYGDSTIIYVNGTSQAVLTGATSSVNPAPIVLSSNLTTLYLTDVICYNRALTFSEVLAIYSSNKGTNIVKYVKDNNIFNNTVTIGNNSQKVTIEDLPVGSTYMLIKAHPNGISRFWEVINSLEPRYDVGEEKGVESKGWRLLAGNTYLITKVDEGQTPSENNFFADKITFSAQGTSSMSYPLKNFRIYFKKKLTFSDKSISVFPEKGSISETAGYTTVFKQGSDVTDVNYTTESGDLAKYRISKDSMPADIFCLKADYAESSGMHNTGFARMANYVLKNSSAINSHPECTTWPQNEVDEAQEQTYPTRSTIDGIQLYLFFEDNEGNRVYHGKYNFNNEKANAEIFGFKPNGTDYTSYFDNSIVLTESLTLKNLFEINDDSYDKTHETVTSKTNSQGFINPTECWEFSSNDSDSLSFTSNDSRWNQLRVIGSFNFPFTTDENGKLYNYPFSNTTAFLDLNPFTVKTNTGDLAWINTEQAWEYRYPDFDDDSEGNIGYTNGTIRPYLLESLYKWLHRNSVYCWDSGLKESHAATFAKYLHYYFNINYLLKYYVLTKMFINGDQRIKNCMLAFVCDPKVEINAGDISDGGSASGTMGCPMGHMRAFYIFYDNDTILGVDNTGSLKNSWNSDETSDVFRGITNNETYFHGLRQGESFHAIWGNIEYCYKAYIDHTSSNPYILQLGELVEKAYDSVRNLLTDSKIKEFFDSKLPDSASNVDLEIKYLYPTTLNPNTSDFLDKSISQYQGSRQYHREWLLNKRLKWFDAKYGSASIKDYYLNYKVQGTFVWEHNNIKLTSVFDNWRFYYKSGDTGILVPTSMLASDEEGVLKHTSTIDSNECFLYGLYGCSKIDMSEFYGNDAGHSLNGINQGSNKLPYLNEIIVGNSNPENTFYAETLDGFFRNANNLTRLTIQNVSNPTGGYFSMDCTLNKNLTYINTIGTKLDIILPEGSLLLTLVLQQPQLLNIINKLNLSNLTVEDTSNLSSITVKHSNDKVYQWALNQYLANPNIDLTIVFGSDIERDVLSQTTIQLMEQVGRLNPSNVSISGIAVYPNSYDYDAIGVFGDELNISASDDKEFEFVYNEGLYLYEDKTLKIGSTLPVSDWTLNITYPEGFNKQISKSNSTQYSCTLSAPQSGTNDSYSFTATVTAVCNGQTYTSLPITIVYNKITSSNIRLVTNSNIVGSTTNIKIELDSSCTKQYLLNLSYSDNFSKSSLSLEDNSAAGETTFVYNNGILEFIQYTPSLDKDARITFTIFRESVEIILYYNSIICTKSELQSNDESILWLLLLLSPYINGFGDNITRSDIKQRQLQTIDGTLVYGTGRVVIDETKGKQDLSKLKYFDTSGNFTIPTNFKFTDLLIPEGASTLTWTSIYNNYFDYGTITLPSSIYRVVVQLELSLVINNLEFDIRKATSITSIYNIGTNEARDGVFNLGITIRGTSFGSGYKNLFKSHNKIKLIGNYSTVINRTDDRFLPPSTTMFNVRDINTNNFITFNDSGTELPPIYNLGTFTNLDGYNVGAISSYRMTAQALNWTECKPYVTGLYYTFYKGSGVPSNTDIDFNKLSYVGDGSFACESTSESSSKMWRTITIPSTITGFGYGAFANFSRSLNTQGSNVTLYNTQANDVGPFAFGYSNITQFYFENIKSIGSRAFVGEGIERNITLKTNERISIANKLDYPFGNKISNINLVTDNLSVISSIQDYSSDLLSLNITDGNN